VRIPVGRGFARRIAAAYQKVIAVRYVPGDGAGLAVLQYLQPAGVGRHGSETEAALLA
jgi:hypothetical protein